MCGAVLDVVVDIRADSSSFGKWIGRELQEHDHHQLWVPPGLAHGFLVLSDGADVIFPLLRAETERCIRWDDAELATG
ncbi:dTDP-4-dehydrorhamnose 3,5-epimerase family protein [Polaromonas sp.]|uniref:dTDP-4-dehydrorhamnose 3,5-epimerase family protein n=1 Tax=Polaromonas sp. TaxID=1869339 RepID=UPI0039C8F901